MDCHDIIKTLTKFSAAFPARAMAEAQARQQEITPLLLDLLREAAENQEKVARDSVNVGYIFAMYLLAQFREKRAFAPLLAFFSTPGDTARRMTGDIITEGLGQLLASVAGGDIQPIQDLVENRQRDPFVRAAALEALLCLVAWNELDASFLADYLAELARRGLERQPSHVWNYLVEAATQCCPAALWPALARAYDEGLVSEFYIGRQEAEEQLRSPLEPRLVALRQNPGLQPITSAAEEMGGWACFQPERTVVRQVAPREPVRRPAKVGRNDPCPCGSGKKYKKCCL